jgi:cyclophilin family peptidyl-prolyl cis-trans isomerase
MLERHGSRRNHRSILFLCVLCALCGCVLRVSAQTPPSPIARRLAILQAEDRRAPTANDVAIIRAGARSDDAQTVRIAVRALGRLERPSLVADIVPALRFAVPEVRAEAATAIGQAAQGWKRDRGAAPAATLDSVIATLVARLKVDTDPDVRAAICETLGRLPYTTVAQADRAETALLDASTRAETIVDRLGIAKAFEVFVRAHRALRPPSDAARALLRRFSMPVADEPATGTRIRRLALEALITAGTVDADLIAAAAKDVDPQMRRLAMRAAAARGPSGAADQVAAAALRDDSPIVRLEALRTLRVQNSPTICDASTAAVSDSNIHVALLAIDQLAGCSASADAVAVLDRLVADRAAVESPRGWHRAAHALTALASASPDRGATALAALSGAPVWQVRLYAARAAATLRNRAVLERFAADDDDNVREAAIGGLKTVAGHDADEVYISQLTRSGNQVVRAAAVALEGTPHPDTAAPALSAALQRLVAERRDNSHDARDAIAKTLAGVSGDNPLRGLTPRSLQGLTPRNDLNVDDLRRLASPRALVTIRDVGTFELALFTAQAPATVLRFAHLAASGYYNGLTFHRVVPNFVIQGGSPGANEYVGDATFMRDELGSWPHVRGAVGISTRGRDTGDAQIFIDLVDNPRLDHEYTVFAQVLNGIDVVDRIVEGDVIEKIDIIAK